MANRVKTHYLDHLGLFYSWMMGDFKSKQVEAQQLFESLQLKSENKETAIDLGAGHGIHSVSLAKLGYRVKAIDFTASLLDELKTNAAGLNVEVYEDDIRNVSHYKVPEPELIICAGDTLTHLEDITEVAELISDCTKLLPSNGKIFFSFRDYIKELPDEKRFIPVRSSVDKIATCVLEYSREHVKVSDLLYQLSPQGEWICQVSSYQKLRLQEGFIMDSVCKSGLEILHWENRAGVISILLMKP